MKVVQIMAGDEEGGLEKHFVELSNGLAAQGVHVVAIACEKYRDRFAANVTFEAMDLTRSRRDPRVLWQLWRTLTRHQPDIVHAQANKAAAMLATVLLAFDTPAIASIHNLKKHLGFLERFTAVIGVSDQVCGQIPHPRVHRVYNGITPPAPLPARARLRQRLHADTTQPLWLAVGRLVPAKGFDILVDAFPARAGHLLIVGDGPDQAVLQQRIQQAGRTEQIQLLGYRDDVTALMQIADAVVISSRREGFSYVFAEALLAGTPVISTDVPIPNEVLDSRYLCPTEDVASLHALMERVAPALQSGTPLYDRPFAFAQTHLTLDAMVHNTLAVYQQVLGMPST